MGSLPLPSEVGVTSAPVENIMDEKLVRNAVQTRLRQLCVKAKTALEPYPH